MGRISISSRAKKDGLCDNVVKFTTCNVRVINRYKMGHVVVNTTLFCEKGLDILT